MMDFEEILAGLADALELERELGVRAVEIDRALLKGTEKGQDQRSSQGDVGSHRSDEDKSILPFVFLHDRALSAKGVEMMAKIVTAMHLTPETAPILFTGTRPEASVTVVLGHRALKHWFPGVVGSPGQWIAPDGLKNVLVTYSPEYFLRFGAETPAVRKLKLDMWTSLKAALQRIASA